VPPQSPPPPSGTREIYASIARKASPVAKNMTWPKAIERVLREAGRAMHYKAIAEQIVSLGLRGSFGATPAATVNGNLNRSIVKLGEKSPFAQTGRGEYVLRECQLGAPRAPGGDLSKDEDEKQYEIISSFGMFWRKDLVEWTRSPLLLGMQQIGAEAVNFADQKGIYLLYDGRQIIYVGRATERPLGRRLYEHTLDRLSARWDRFSWFGLLPVSERGKLGDLPEAYQSTKLIPAFEAVLVEALEPPQNRKRGDDLAAVEYLQQEDPEVKKRRVKDALDAVLSRT